MNGKNKIISDYYSCFLLVIKGGFLFATTKNKIIKEII